MIESGAAIVIAALVAGCGSTYRPVITPLNPTGPAPQPTSLVAVVSAPLPTSPGCTGTNTSSATTCLGEATVLDYSGDTIAAESPIGPGPVAFTVDAVGSTGYTVNSNGTITNFPFSANLQQKNVTTSTLPPLPADAAATAIPVGMFSPSTGLWIADHFGGAIDILTGSPETFQQSVPVAATPVTIAGLGTGAQYYYAVSLNNQDTPAASAIPFEDMTCNNNPAATTEAGEADSIPVTQRSVNAHIPLGKCPTYTVQSPDGKRLFVLNRGSDTISVINTQNDSLDQCAPFTNQSGQPVSCHPCLPLTNAAVVAGDGSGATDCAATSGSNLESAGPAGPVYAEYVPATNQLVVSNYDGGTVSVIDVTLDQYGNDSPTFGTTYTIPVGKNPSAVTVLNDGKGDRAYAANQTDGTVSVLNLSSHTVTKTLAVVGHPRTVVSTANSLYGKVYVASPDSTYVTIIRTDQDIVDTTVLVQGNVVDVRVSTQNAVSGNTNMTSRPPGAGQPCYLPNSVLGTATPTYAQCQSQSAP